MGSGRNRRCQRESARLIRTLSEPSKWYSHAPSVEDILHCLCSIRPRSDFNKEPFTFTPMTASILILFAVGISVGSFVNVCAYRLPRNISIGIRSFCPDCLHALSWFEIVPLLSFILLRGKCRFCASKVSIRYPMVEMYIGGLLLFAFVLFGASERFIFSASYLILMFVIAIIDWQHLIIPNKVIVTGLIIGFALRAFSIGSEIQSFPLTVQSPLLSAVISPLLSLCSMLVLLLFGNWLFKKPSLGMGDVKLAALVGFFLGFQEFLMALWLAAIVGCVFAIFLKINRKPLLSLRSEIKNQKSKMDSAANSGPLLPFGSFLAVSSSVVLVFSEPINALLGSWLTLMQ